MQQPGRPERYESARRKGRFLELVATGMRPREAASQAGISMGRALDIVSDPGYPALLDAMRSTEALAA